MLIAVAVVAILTALIIPGVKNSLQGSRQAACTFNLRQLGKASALYAADNDNNLPPAYMEKMGTFTYFLAPYAGGMKSQCVSPDIFYCPENVAQNTPPAAGWVQPGDIYYKGWSGYFLSYAINSSVHFNIYEDAAERAQGLIRKPVKLTEVQMPTKTISLVDMTLPWPKNGPPPSSGFKGANYFDPKNASFGLGLQHNGVGNVLFVDGHVESFSGNKPLPVASLPSQTETWH